MDQLKSEQSSEDASAETERPNLIDRTADRLDALHRRIPPAAFLHGVIKKYGEDLCGQLAMLLTYRGFFAVFPLLLVFVNVVGIILDDNPELRDQLIGSTVASLPIIGTEIQNNSQSVGGSALVVIFATLVSIWAGLGLLDMLQEALNTIWGVPRFERPPFLIRKLRSLPAVLMVGLALVISGASAWIFGTGQSRLQVLGEYLLPFLAASLCVIGLHYVLCYRKVALSAVLPAALLTGVGWMALQQLGGWYVNRFVVNSSDTYGIFVVVFGLMSWIYLLALVYLLSNEVSVVLLESRWPRSLTGRNLTPQDKAAVNDVLRRTLRVRDVDVDIDVPEHPR